MVAIPLGQGQVFNKELMTFLATETESQSLWVRDRFLMLADVKTMHEEMVAIPLGQGQVFN